MLAGSVILILTVFCFFLLWKNYSENKKNSLDKLELENQLTQLKSKLSKAIEENSKTEDKQKVLVEELEAIKHQVPEKEFKYITAFGSDRSRALRDKLVKTSKDTGYSVQRAYALWSHNEDVALIHRYSIERKTVWDLAVIHERTPSSISRRLKMLKLL